MSAIEISQCSRCRKSAILFQEYSGQHYCPSCLIRSVRKRIGKELRKQLILPKSEKNQLTTIMVAVSGGKDSTYQALYARDELKLNPLLVTL